MDPRRLGAAQQRSDVLRILERIEDQDERWLAAIRGPRQDVVERGEAPRFDHERDALMSVEAGQRGQRSALDLDDRDAQSGGMQDELFQRVATLRDDEQSVRRSTGREDLLDRTPAGDELLVGSQEVRGRQRGDRPRPGRNVLTRADPWSRARRPPGSTRSVRSDVRTERRPVTGGSAAVRRPRPRSRRRSGRSRRTGPRIWTLIPVARWA
jgi:hypothetical protein